MRRLVCLLALLGILVLTIGATPAKDFDAKVRAALTPAPNVAALKQLGQRAMPAMVAMYRTSDEERRAAIAATWYALGWESPEAKAALMQDIGTQHQGLRLQVQWALGRVSDDADVVDTLARIMQHDANALFRDKAACALAYDQIHLTEAQKVRLYEKVIRALRDPKPQVRQIATQVLQIHLGQMKGFDPNGAPEAREQAVRAWEKWLTEYRSQL